MTRFVCLYISILAAVLGSWGCSKSTDSRSELHNRVYMPEKIEVSGGQHFAVPILFDNEVAVGSINLPLLYPSSFMRLDSISLIDSRVAGFKFKSIFLEPDTIVLKFVDDSSAIAPGSGLLASAYFWVHGNAPETTFVFNKFDYWKLPYGFSDSNLVPVENPPQFQGSQIHVRTIVRT